MAEQNIMQIAENVFMKPLSQADMSKIVRGICPACGDKIHPIYLVCEGCGGMFIRPKYEPA